MVSRISFYSLGLGFLLLASGCAGLNGTSTDVNKSDVVVAKKAQARWDALIAGNMEVVYGYLSPATRSTITLDAYTKRYRLGIWSKAAVDKVSCDAERCKVAMRIELKNASGGTPIETYLNELWVSDGSEWWYVWK